MTNKIQATLVVSAIYSEEASNGDTVIGWSLVLTSIDEYTSYTCLTAKIASRRVKRIIRDCKSDLLNLYIRAEDDSFYNYDGLHKYK